MSCLLHQIFRLVVLIAVILLCPQYHYPLNQLAADRMMWTTEMKMISNHQAPADQNRLATDHMPSIDDVDGLPIGMRTAAEIRISSCL